MEKQPTHQELIKDIRGHLQFLITVAILVSVVIRDFFVAMGENEVLSQGKANTWLLGVGLSVVSYLLIGLGKELSQKVLVYTKRSIIVNLAFLASMIVTVIAVQFGALPAYFEWILRISIWGSLLTPFVTFALIFISLFWVLGQSFPQVLRLKRKKARDD